MALSKKHKLIFIHIPKCAGTSVIKHLNLELPGHYSASKPIAEIQPYMNNPDYFKFCIVRNPWDRLISSFEYAKMEESYYHSKASPHIDYHILKNKSLNDLLDILINYRHLLRHECWHPQLDWITDSSDNILVDKIIKIEDLDIEMPKILSRLNYTSDLPKLNQSVRENYKKYYDEVTQKKVALFYKKDIEFLNYEF